MLTLIAALTIRAGGIGTSAVERIQTSLGLLGCTHQQLVEKVGRAKATVENNIVWVYGPWVPSPRLGFTCSFFHEDDGARVGFDTVQYVSGSVSTLHSKTLKMAQWIFGSSLSDIDKQNGGAKAVPKDFAWTSDEKTSKVLDDLKAENVQHFTQEKNPLIVLTTCQIDGKNVYMFSRQVDGATITPVFTFNVSGDNRQKTESFDADKLDLYSFAVGYCSKWQYTAGYSMEKLIGPGSYADTSMSDEPWVKL